MVKLQEVIQTLSDDQVEFILVQFVDITGAAKVKMMPASCLQDAAESGAGFAGAAVAGGGQGPHSHDMMARVDLDTYTPLAWQPGTARFASNLYVDDAPHPYCSRNNLERVLGEAREKGYVFNVGMEPEHFLVTSNSDGSIAVWDPENVDTLAKPCYDYRSMAPAMDYLQELTSALNVLGWGVYQCDHEDGNGQFEVNFDYTDALETADRITFFRMAASQIAAQYGAIATFMPKPFADRTGSGLHAHFHIADTKTGENIFIDPNDSRGLECSPLAYHFIGGVLRHARALCAINSPTVNCYKRLQAGGGVYSSRSGFTWTPAFISYGDNNRTQMIRTAGPGHFEDRTLSSAANPYLSLAAYLAAGLDGIENEIDPGDPNVRNMYELSPTEIQESGIGILPQSLDEALEELRNDSVVQGGLGPIAEEFMATKTEELSAYRADVSRWEIERYLGAI